MPSMHPSDDLIPHMSSGHLSITRTGAGVGPTGG